MKESCHACGGSCLEYMYSFICVGNCFFMSDNERKERERAREREIYLIRHDYPCGRTYQRVMSRK